MNEITIVALGITGVLIVALAILRLRHASLQSLTLGLVGAILGLLLGALASVPLSRLPSPWGSLLPVAVTILLTVILVGVAVSRRRSLPSQLSWMSERVANDPAEPPATETPAAAPTPEPTPGLLPPILVDTSVIIDGRISDIAAAGFVPGRLVVPRFVLAELQNIADSDDAMRRGRGRRGLDVLNNLRDMPGVGVEIIDDDVAGIREVDAKLVALAQKFGCNVLTTDYNLNRVAQIQGVRVLNVNELSNAIRPVVLPGEELVVRVVQPGKERNQGVGYLADGTMIVVENGDKLIGQEIATEVTRVFQTVAGKMIFAAPRKDGSAAQATPSATPKTNAPAVDKPLHHDQRTAAANTEPHDRRGRDSRDRRSRKHNNNSAHNGHQAGNPSINSNPPARHTSLEDRVIAAANDPKPHSPGPTPDRPPTDRA